MLHGFHRISGCVNVLSVVSPVFVFITIVGCVHDRIDEQVPSVWLVKELFLHRVPLSGFHFGYGGSIVQSWFFSLLKWVPQSLCVLVFRLSHAKTSSPLDFLEASRIHRPRWLKRFRLYLLLDRNPLRCHWLFCIVLPKCLIILKLLYLRVIASDSVLKLEIKLHIEMSIGSI